MRNKVKRLAKRGKLMWMDTQLREKTGPKESWKCVKTLRKEFAPQHTNLVNENGRLPKQSEDLGRWVNNQREEFKPGGRRRNRTRLSDERIAELESIPGWLWSVKKRNR